MDIVKFSKGVQIQARNNRGTRYLNYKLLIRKIRWVAEQEEKENWSEAQRYDLIFKDILFRDMNRMDTMYSRDITYIRDMMCVLTRSLWSLSCSNSEKNGLNMNEFNEVTQLPVVFLSNLLAFLNPYIDYNNKLQEKKVMEWLYNLLECYGKLIRLRSYIIWNSIAVIKVLKKRHAKISPKRRAVNPLDCYALLSSHEFYNGKTLGYLNDMIRDLVIKVFKVDLTTETCRKCFKTTSEPIKTICNHIVCWKCVINIGEISYPKIKNLYYQPMEFHNMINNQIIYYKPFKNCPVCFTSWNRNPESIQVENKLIRLCIDFFNRTERLPNIPEIDTVVQAAVSNVGYISSDEETDKETSGLYNISPLSHVTTSTVGSNGDSSRSSTRSSSSFTSQFSQKLGFDRKSIIEQIDRQSVFVDNSDWTTISNTHIILNNGTINTRQTLYYDKSGGSPYTTSSVTSSNSNKSLKDTNNYEHNLSGEGYGGTTDNKVLNIDSAIKSDMWSWNPAHYVPSWYTDSSSIGISSQKFPFKEESETNIWCFEKNRTNNYQRTTLLNNSVCINELSYSTKSNLTPTNLEKSDNLWNFIEWQSTENKKANSYNNSNINVNSCWSISNWTPFNNSNSLYDLTTSTYKTSDETNLEASKLLDLFQDLGV
ncbi:hypothetical protein cand_008140 [Cryptosporidium andersoni]|uniref:SPX domain-containing protein n=1 Tax=Cryptosporidium andersoni TaxID=117008 RepID=A0A1J4MSR2_9CRYT|nr:hypothetical protein cand_008140 [Cryptosporidium andersoni]